MAKYKVGDPVTIKKGLTGGVHYNGLYFAYSMEEFCGMKANIVDVTYNGDYFLDITNDWVFNDAMLISDTDLCKFMKRNKV